MVFKELVDKLKTDRKLQKNIGLFAAMVVLSVTLLLFLFFIFKQQESPDLKEPTVSIMTPTTGPDSTSIPDSTTNTTVPENTIPTMLPHMEALYNQNSEIAGWLSIDNTVVDYPVMFTPDDPEKYIYKNFQGRYDIKGSLFIDGHCNIDPESDNIIIYGHNMLNGTMFRPIYLYKEESYWREHPTIKYTTLYEEREYEVIAAFYDRVYYNYEDVFKFYRFIDAEDKADYENAMMNYKNKALYDTGVTAEYGDHLLTLVTCSGGYGGDGRFVVVLREKTDFK